MKSLLHVAEKHGSPHKLLLQMICQLGGIRLSQIIEVFQTICDNCATPTTIPEQCTIKSLSKALVKTITPIITPLDLKIAVTTDYRFPDEQFLTLFSTSATSKFTKFLTPDELEIFKKWFNLVFVEGRHKGELDGVEAINIQIDGRRRPLNCETFLKKLIDDNILVKLHNHNSYIFTTKSLMELEPRLRAGNYDLPPCPVCGFLVIVQRFAHTCETCGTLMHNTCLYKMINLSNTAVACPGRCTKRYDRDFLEDAEFDVDLPEAVNQPVEIRGQVRAQETEDDDYDEEMEEDIAVEEEDAHRERIEIQ